MRSPHLQIPLIVICAVLLASCNEPFSPRGPYVQRHVVYSVLTTQSDTQYVRVYWNYNPPEDNPLSVNAEEPDTTATVTISDGSRTIILRDTILFRTEPSQAVTPVHAFVTTLFRPQPASSYTLTVTTASELPTSAQTTVPAAGSLNVPERYKLYQPVQFIDESITVVDNFSSLAKGYICRFLIEYGLQSDSLFRGEMEVPISVSSGNSGSELPIYQSLQRITYTLGGASYPVRLYVDVMTKILGLHGNDTKFTLAKFYCIQVDPNLYNYYNIANGFQDAFSTRTDQPDFTNIRNGLGVFGSFNVDSVSFDISQPITLPQFQSR